LILYWSIAVTDFLVLDLKASEAARFALWETTVWKPPSRIDREVRQRFQDLRSPSGIDRASSGLTLFPRSSSLRWSAEVDVAADEVLLAGARLPFNAPGFSARSWLPRPVDGGRSAGGDAPERFNTLGVASARSRLVTAGGLRSSILAGGDLPGRRGGNDLAAPRSLAELSLASPLADRRPLQLVFDTWKAWPKPATFQLTRAPGDVGVSPKETYPEVEKQVAAQVDAIAFFGMRQKPWFTALDSITARIQRSTIAGALLGGRLPRIFSTGRMDSPEGGPVSILPQGTKRAGGIVSRTATRLTGLDAYTEAKT